MIMPGSGVRSNNINEIIQSTGAKEIHSSARQMHSSQMLFTKESMNENLQATGVDAEEIKKMLASLAS
jgi:copper homeostasis protein